MAKRKKQLNPEFQVNDLVQTAVLKKTFSKGDNTNWSYNNLKTVEGINDAKPSYRIDHLPERQNQALLRKTELSLKENKVGMKALGLY